MWTIEIIKPLHPGETLEDAERRILSADERVLFMRPSAYVPTAVYKLEPQPSDELGEALMKMGDLSGFGSRVSWLDDAGLILAQVLSGDGAAATRQIAERRSELGLVDTQKKPPFEN